MATVTRENIGLLNDKLTVNLVKEDYLPAFEKSLKEYAKKAKISGFRQGMVPIGVIKKMYGQSVFTDGVIKSVEKQLTEYLETEKLNIFSQPLPLANDIGIFDMNNPGDYAFAFEIGLRPDVDINIENITVTRYKPEITDQIIDEEVNRLQARFGKRNELDTIENEDNLLTVRFSETDKEGNISENGINKTSNVGVKYFTESLRSELIGKKRDDTFNIQINKDVEEKEKEWLIKELGLNETGASDADKYFKLQIITITLMENAELNEELFDKAYPGKEIKTIEDFRAAVKAEIENHYHHQSSNQVHDQIYHQLLDQTKIEFPENFLKRLIREGGKEQVSAEEAEKEYPGFQFQLKWSLISNKLLSDNKISVQENEIKDAATRQMLDYIGGGSLPDGAPWLAEYTERMLKDKKFVENTYSRLQSEKLFTALEEQVNEIEESISVADFATKLHNHHH